MQPDVQTLLRAAAKIGSAAEMSLHGGVISLQFASGRAQRVRWKEQDGAIVLSSRAVGAPVVAQLGRSKAAELIWQRNREVDVVRFILDSGARIMVEASLPLEGAAAEDLRFLIDRAAEEADRLEFLLTGEDRG